MSRTDRTVRGDRRCDATITPIAVRRQGTDLSSMELIALLEAEPDVASVLTILADDAIPAAARDIVRRQLVGIVRMIRLTLPTVTT